MIDKYKDIINLAHPISKNHPRMPISGRAAQFLPFAALSGYEEAIEETGRYTMERIELTPEYKSNLDEKLQYLKALKVMPIVSICYYNTKDNSYKLEKGYITEFNERSQNITLSNGIILNFEDIYSIESDCFNKIF